MAVSRVAWLVLTGAVCCALAACTAAPEPGLWPTPSRRPSPSPSLASTPPPQASVEPPTINVKSVNTIQIPQADDLVVDPKTHTVYVSSEAGKLSAVAAGTGQVAKTILVGKTSGALVLDSAAGLIYAGHQSGKRVGTVSVIDARSLKVVDTIRIGGGGQPNGLALDPATGRLFSVDDGHATVIDTHSRTVIGSIAIGETGFGVVVDSKAGTAFVSGEEQILAIDTKTLAVRDLITTEGGGDISMDSSTGQVFIGHEAAGRVSVIATKTRKVANTVAIGGPYGPFGVLIDSRARLGYVMGARQGRIEVFDTLALEVVGEIARPNRTEQYGLLAVDPFTGLLYLRSEDDILVVARD